MLESEGQSFFSDDSACRILKMKNGTSLSSGRKDVPQQSLVQQ